MLFPHFYDFTLFLKCAKWVGVPKLLSGSAIVCICACTCICVVWCLVGFGWPSCNSNQETLLTQMMRRELDLYAHCVSEKACIWWRCPAVCWLYAAGMCWKTPGVYRTKERAHFVLKAWFRSAFPCQTNEIQTQLSFSGRNFTRLFKRAALSGDWLSEGFIWDYSGRWSGN